MDEIFHEIFHMETISNRLQQPLLTFYPYGQQEGEQFIIVWLRPLSMWANKQKVTSIFSFHPRHYMEVTCKSITR